MLQVGDLFELNIKLRCQKVKWIIITLLLFICHLPSTVDSEFLQSIIETFVYQDIYCNCVNCSRFHTKVKVKCTLVQALRLCTDLTAYTESRGIALLFHDQRHLKGVRGQRHAPAALYPRERPGTHCTGGWLVPRAGLDRCGKSRPHRNSIPEASSP